MPETGCRRDLLAALRDAEPTEGSALVPLLYADLRRLARSFLSHERPGHTLQATALVHELYLRLIPQGEATRFDRARFFAIAARAMREILVEHARARHRHKRGGGQRREPLEDDVAVIDAVRRAQGRPVEALGLHQRALAMRRDRAATSGAYMFVPGS